MPRYDFRCPDGHVETFVHTMDSITDHPTHECSQCGMESVRIFSSGGHLMRPDGWYLKPEDKGYYDIPASRTPHVVAQQKERTR